MQAAAQAQTTKEHMRAAAKDAAELGSIHDQDISQPQDSNKLDFPEAHASRWVVLQLA